MVEQISCPLSRGFEGLTSATLRYGCLERLSKSAGERSVAVLAFAIAPNELRVVVDGESADIANVIRGVKGGTGRVARRLNAIIEWGDTQRDAVPAGRLDEAVAWVHSLPVEAGIPRPLASPWSSHRDLMGYRRARFYDPAVLRGRVDRKRVHALAKGGPLPARRLPATRRPESLTTLLRVAAACLGVLPADRRCFQLFAHLARQRGWQTIFIADALALTTRRIRQLLAKPEPVLPMALQCLGDPRLSVVP